MPFFNDFVYMELDFYLTTFFYLILGGDSTRVAERADENFVFPSLAKRAIAVATIVTGIIRDGLRSKYPAVVEWYSGTSLRMGSGMHIANHPKCSLWHTIVRGGWDLRGDCRAFEYILGCMVSMSIAGRALSGWPYPHSSTVSPRCVQWDNADPTATTTANNFKCALFEHR
jgi:hypothetical protein